MIQKDSCKHNNTSKRGNQYFSGIKCNDCREWVEKRVTKKINKEQKKENHGLGCEKKNKKKTKTNDKSCTELENKPISRKDRPGYVYIMQGSDKGRIKIGRSTDLVTRLKAAKTFDPDMVILSMYYSEDHKCAEVVIHRLLSEYRIIKSGPGIEWFKMNRFTAEKAISGVIKEISELPIRC